MSIKLQRKVLTAALGISAGILAGFYAFLLKEVIQDELAVRKPGVRSLKNAEPAEESGSEEEGLDQ